MLDRKFVRENMDAVRAMLAARKTDLDTASLEALDAERRALLAEIEGLRHKQKAASEEIARIKREKGDASAIIAEMGGISTRVKEAEPRLREIEEQYDALLFTLPNLPDDETPRGMSEADNVRRRDWGEPRRFEFEVRDHVAIGEALGILDMERAAKMSGARFVLQMGTGARLSRALTAFMLDMHTREHGYVEVLPPFMVNTEAMTGTGQLPKFSEDLFRIEGRDLWLIPTAEVPVTNIHRDETISADELPKKYVAYTPCFRAEAGSHGKDTRGMIRVHQFDKVELVQITRPEDSKTAHEELTAHAEKVLQRLELPYRVMELCTADLGFAARRCYDLEVWLPSQNTYREISSCSNFGDFQARRAGIRFRDKTEKSSQLAHTLNGSGLAVGRTFVAILENYQNADGTVTIPPALRPFMDGMERIEE
ncbi:serine--tRNA ligase [bacterium]|nr:serine--tRNA ligase [bacterium]